MITPFENLSDKDKNIIKDAPFWVAMWVGLADGNFDQKEQIKAIQTLEIKSFSESPDISAVYKEIQNPTARLVELLDTLNGDSESNKNIVKEKLVEVRDAIQRTEPAFGNALFRSLKNVGVHVAMTSGGIFGYETISKSEKVALSLDFLKPEF